MFKYNTELLDEISALPIVNDLVTIQDMMRWGIAILMPLIFITGTATIMRGTRHNN